MRLFADLRMKMESSTQEEPLSSTAGTGIGSNSSANGSLGPISNYDTDRDKADLMPTTLWNSVAGKLPHKSGSVNTPDGKHFYSYFTIFSNYVLLLYLFQIYRS